MDRVGRRYGLSLGNGLGMIGALIGGIAIIISSFWVLCLGMLLMGMGRGAVDLGRFAAAEVYEENRRAKVIGLIVFAGTIGAIGGPLLVPITSNFVERFEMSRSVGPYFAAALFLLISTVIVFAFLRPDPMRIGRLLTAEQEAIHKTVKVPERTLRQIFSDGQVQLAIAAMAIGQLVMTLLMTITPLHMSHHEHGEGAISGVIMAHTLGMFGLSGVTGWLVDRYGRIAMIVGGAVVLIVASVMSPMSTAVVPLAISLFLLGLGWNFCFVAGSTLLADSLRANERGQVQGASDTLVSLASGIGSLTTGYVFDHWGMVAIGGVGLACTLILLATTAWRTRPQLAVE
jgi:MFS family permease